MLDARDSDKSELVSSRKANLQGRPGRVHNSALGRTPSRDCLYAGAAQLGPRGPLAWQEQGCVKHRSDHWRSGWGNDEAAFCRRLAHRCRSLSRWSDCFKRLPLTTVNRKDHGSREIPDGWSLRETNRRKNRYGACGGGSGKEGPGRPSLKAVLRSNAEASVREVEEAPGRME